jgi:hypothetical protein
METYVAYGLNISSELPLPELAVTDAKPDVYIRFSPLDSPTLLTAYSSDSYVGESKLGRFLINDGRELFIDPSPALDQAKLRPFILGPVLAYLLRIRGLLTLHASCVAIYGTAVAFVGNTGWGKSTIAKGLHDRGFPLISDDLLAIDLKDGNVLTIPGLPLIKLWPDAAAALGSDPSQFSKLHSETEKLLHCLTHDFQQEVVPLQRVYILAKGEEVRIHRLSPQNALVNILAHSWGAKNLSARHFRETHLEQCAMLVNKVPVFRLERPPDLQLLPHICDMILTDRKEQMPCRE